MRRRRRNTNIEGFPGNQGRTDRSKNRLARWTLTNRNYWSISFFVSPPNRMISFRSIAWPLINSFL